MAFAAPVEALNIWTKSASRSGRRTSAVQREDLQVGETAKQQAKQPLTAKDASRKGHKTSLHLPGSQTKAERKQKIRK
jgi:hypothetical protein